MQKIFSQEIRFKDENGNSYPDWEENELKAVATIDWGNTKLTKSSYVNGGKFLAVSATGADGRIDHAEYRVGTIVLSAIGANCGFLIRPNEDFTAIKNTITISARRNKSISGYIYFSLLRSVIPKRGAAQPFISKGDLESLTFAFPSLLEQQKIADFLTSLDEKISAISSELDRAKAFKKGLLQQMFV